MTCNDRVSPLFFACLLLLLFTCSPGAKAEDKEAAPVDAVKNDAALEPFLRPINVDESKSWATLGRLYIIVATDDLLDGVPGNVAKSNGETVENMFRQQLATGAFAVIRIPAEKLTRQMIFTVITNLPLKSRDAVCLYFSGKGGHDRKKGSCFELSRGKEELYRSELRNALAKKGCRLSVLISDFCDSYSLPAKPQPKEKVADSTEAVAETGAETEKQENNATEEVKSTTGAAAESKTTSPLFFSMFFQTHGTVDVISATVPMQQSLSTWQGNGCFTEAMEGLSRTNRNKFMSWYRFFPYLSAGAGLLFKDNYPDGFMMAGGLKQSLQTPMLMTLGQDDFNPTVFADCYPQGKDFSQPVPDAAEGEIPLTDDDRQFIADLLQKAVGCIRPQDDQDKGTHEDVAALDPDNTVNGFDGEPFSLVLPSLKPIRWSRQSEARENVEDDRSVTATAETTVASDKNPRFGVAAMANNGDGVKITHVFDDLPGKRAGLVIGDVILKVDGKQITSEQEYSNAIDAAGEIMILEVRNATGGNVVTLRVRMRSGK